MGITELREKYRYKDIALFDLVASFIVIIYLVVVNRGDMSTGMAVVVGALLTLPISIVSHKVFGINTTLNYRLGLSDAPARPNKPAQSNMSGGGCPFYPK